MKSRKDTSNFFLHFLGLFQIPTQNLTLMQIQSFTRIGSCLYCQHLSRLQRQFFESSSHIPRITMMCDDDAVVTNMLQTS